MATTKINILLEASNRVSAVLQQISKDAEVVSNQLGGSFAKGFGDAAKGSQQLSSAVDRVKQVFQGVENTVAKIGGTFQGIGQRVKDTLGTAFDSLARNSSVVQLAVLNVQKAIGQTGQAVSRLSEPFQRVKDVVSGGLGAAFDSIQARITQTGREINNQIEQSKFRFTEFNRIIKDGLSQAFQGSPLQGLAQKVQSETGKAQATLERFKAGLKTAIDGNPLASAISRDIGSLGRLIPESLNRIGSRVKQLAPKAFEGLQQAAQAQADKLPAVFQSIGNKVGGLFDNLLSKFKKSTTAGAGAGQPDDGKGFFGSLFGNVTGLIPKLGALGLAFGAVQQAIGLAQQAGGFFYEKLIKGNVELQEQLLSTKATLVATNKVIQGGVEIKDPTQAIKALEGPVNNAVARIRQGSLELVGVTSAQLIPIFQNISGQASQIGANLSQSADLTLSFAAALGTLSIPLEQQRQEVTSILQAQISSDSTLAKSLNITNDQVNNWKAQGVLVDKLNEKLAAFKAGNALAAQTINGVASNIQELFDEITRKAGEPFLMPIVDGLNQVYEFLKQNQGAIQDFISTVAQTAFKTAEAIISVGKSVVDVLGAENIGKFGLAIQSTLEFAGNAVEGFAIQVRELVDSPQFQLLRQGFDFLGKAPEGLSLLPQALAEVSGATGAVNEALETASTRTGDLSNNSLELQKKLKALNDQEIINGTLTPEQQKQREELSKKIKVQTGAIEDQIKVLKGLNPQNESQRVQIQAQIGELEKQKNALNDTKLATQQLADKQSLLGESLKGLKQAQDNLKQGGTDQGKLDTAGKDIIARVKELREAGAYTSQQAAEELKKVSENAKLSNEVRLQAQQEYFKELETLDDKRQEQIKTAQAEIEAQVEAGQLSGVEAAQKTGELKAEALDLELKNAKLVNQEKLALIDKEIAKEQELINKKLEVAQAELTKAQASGNQVQIAQAKKAVDEINKQKEQIETAAQNKRNQANEEFANKEKTLNAQKLKNSVETERNITAEKLKEIDQREGKAQDAIEEAEINANTKTQQRINQGVIDQGDAEVEKLAATQTRTKGELEAEREKLEALQKLPKPRNPDEAEKLENQIRDSYRKTSKLSLDLMKSELEMRRKVFDAKLAKIDRKQAKIDDEIAQKSAEKELEIQQKLKSGAIDRTEAEKQQGIATVDRTKAELKAEEQKLAALQKLPKVNTPEDIEKRENLIRDSKRKTTELQTQLIKAQLDNEKKAADAALEALQKKEEKARAVLEQAEVDRKIALQKLINSGDLSAEEAEAKKLELTKTRIDAEIKAEQDKVKALEALPKAENKEEIERREKLIRDSKLKTSQLVLQQLENEKAAQDAAVKAIQKKIDDQLAKEKNAYTAINAELEKQLTLQDSLSKILDAQSKLLQARQQLQEAQSGAIKSQYDLSIRLLEGQFSEEDRLKAAQERRAELQKKLAEAKTPEETSAAKKELELLDKQEAREKQLRELRIEAKKAEIEQALKKFQLDDDALRLEEAREQILQRQEQTKLKMAAIDAKANTATAKANLAKLEADPNASKEEKEAAKLQLQSAQMKEEGVAEQQQLLKEQSKYNADFAEIKRQNQETQQGLQLGTLKADLAQLTPGTEDDIKEQKFNLNAARLNRKGEYTAGGTKMSFNELDNRIVDGINELADRYDEREAKVRAAGGSVPEGIQKSVQPPSATFPGQGTTIAAPAQAQSPMSKELTGAVTEIKSLVRVLADRPPQGTTVNQKIEGVSDPKEAARLASKEIRNDLKKAFAGAAR